MASRLKAAIDQGPEGGGGATHIVAVDEIGNRFRDPRPRAEYRTVVVGGTRYRVAAHHEILPTESGWTLERTPAPPAEPPGREHPGSRLSRAMRILAGMPAPWGGTYAERVHLFAAPALTTSIAHGHGPHFTLSSDGTKRVRAGWRGVSGALAAAGGVWLAMYHGDGGPVDARTWRVGPVRVAKYVQRHGGDPHRVHMVLSGFSEAPEGAPEGCGTGLRCAFALARAPQNAGVLVNGVGAWRLGSRAAEFAAELDRSYG
jgi:hypothetical protein